MTFNELNTLQYDVYEKTKAFKTFAVLFQVAVLATPTINSQAEKLPELIDISALALILANQAEDAADKLLNNMPACLKGLTP
jgi:hypothetical protein